MQRFAPKPAGPGPSLSIRLKLTALYAALVLATTGVLLLLSWWLLDNHLDRTLPPEFAQDVSGRLLWQYAVALVGTMLIAVGTGWLLAGRALAPLDATLARLEAVVESQRHFVANASHELRSPLTMIRTEAEVTLDDPHATVEELREMGRVVLEASDRTEALLDGLLVLALSQRGVIKDDPVDLAALAGRVARALRPEAAGAGVHFSVEASRAMVLGDEPLLERMVANLVENAVRHNERGGWATLTVCEDGGKAVVRVANDGPVIEPAALERIAEPFQRLDRASPRRGSGLGLSIVRSVAEAHGGVLSVRARADGGLDVGVSLPLARSAYPELTRGVLDSGSCTTPTTSPR